MKFPVIPDDLSALTDAELEALHSTAIAAFNEGAEGEPDDETVAGLSTLADGIDRVRGAQTERAELAADRQNTINELANRVNATTGDDEGESTDDAEGEPAEETPTETKVEETKTEETKTTEEKPANTTASIAQLKRNAPARTSPRPVAPEGNGRVGQVNMVAAAGVPGHVAGDNITNMREAADLLLKRKRTLGRGDGDDVPVVQFNLDVPEERRLGRDSDVLARLADFDMSAKGITAAGGLCAPVNNYYNQMVIATADRPVRDALANFNADRGGIRFNPSPRMSSITSGVGTVTATQDAASATKTCFTVTCPSIQEVDIVAIYNCLTFGNFSARTFPEQVAAWTELALAKQASVSEQFLLDQIAANSVTVTTAGLVGAGRELFARYGQAAAGMRSRNRMDPEAPIRVLLPSWTSDLVQADWARTFTDVPGFIGMSDADIERLFGVRGLNVTWYLDTKTGGGQIMGGPGGGQSYTDAVTNGTTTVTSATATFTAADIGKTITGTNIPAGATIASVTNATTVVISAAATGSGSAGALNVGRNVLAQFPTTVYGYMFPEGSFLHLDGGTLDLGLVRDSTLNSSNQFRLFTENFENVAFVGIESMEIVSNLNADGSYAAARTITLPINS